MSVGPIKQRLTDGPPALAAMLPGQLFIDEAAQTLWTAGIYAPLSMPLGRQPFPARSGDAGEVLMQGEDGPAYGVLSAGGGGQPVDSGWSVPGLIAHAVTPMTLVGSYVFEIEITQPVRIMEVWLDAATSGPFGVRVSTLTGQSVIEQTLTLGQPTDWNSPILTPAPYRVTVTVNDPIEVVGLSGSLSNRSEQIAPVFFLLEVQ